MSPTLVNVDFTDLEQKMSKEQERGIVIGRMIIWSISYAEDVVLIANNIVGLNGWIRRFKRYIRKKGLELHVKSQMS